jgi:hypothetical protein
LRVTTTATTLTVYGRSIHWAYCWYEQAHRLNGKCTVC